MKKISIAIDGPASSGKSTVAKIVAKKMNYVYCDTGAMYRSLTHLALSNKIDIENDKALCELLSKHTISFKQKNDGQLVFIDQTDVTELIRQSNVTNAVSAVSAHGGVRKKMVELQQEIGKQGGIVMDGRDIGTTVLPDAEVKIFLVASVEERAERRYKENIGKGITTDFETLKKEIERRDRLDSTREVSPLVQAEDAVRVDTTGMKIAQVVERIESIITEKVG